MMHKLIVSICFLVLTAGAAFAQSNTGEITGTVHDPQGAVVPGATITITSAATGLVRTATTPDNGLFRRSDRRLQPHGRKIRIRSGESRER